ncbi:hypothetical protein EGJ27_14960 [Pseudomonas sp. v388]|nr:hypothetical protein EGJ27_14960 [Pseudomonas sp. v388]
MVVTVLGSYYTYSLLKAIYIISKLAPVRFNRQRREVAYMVKRGDTPRIVPWEDVIACVSTSTTITEYGTQNSFALKIGLHAGLEDRLLWLQVPSPTLESAVSEWEAIRVYMEEGPTALPVPFMAGMPEEGTVAYFHACRRNYRERHSYIRYVCGFLLIQFCSGWTLPNHIAEWVERLPRTGFPKAVREWSKPLPPEQWAKPSAELLEESKVVRRSFRKGVDLFQYFKERRTEPPR